MARLLQILLKGRALTAPFDGASIRVREQSKRGAGGWWGVMGLDINHNETPGMWKLGVVSTINNTFNFFTWFWVYHFWIVTHIASLKLEYVVPSLGLASDSPNCVVLLPPLKQPNQIQGTVAKDTLLSGTRSG